MSDSCPRCRIPVGTHEAACPRCGESLGFPNVREATTQSEVEALDRRYRDARQLGCMAGHEPMIDRLESALGNSAAVINMHPKLLEQFLTGDKSLYSSYGLQVNAQCRRLADTEDDKQRRTIDGKFFGSYADQIRFAALSIDGSGPVSYVTRTSHHYHSASLPTVIGESQDWINRRSATHKQSMKHPIQ